MTAPDNPSRRVGLCADCLHARVIHSDRGSTYYLCQRALTDASFPKYPQLPVWICPGYEHREPMLHSSS